MRGLVSEAIITTREEAALPVAIIIVCCRDAPSARTDGLSVAWYRVRLGRRTSYSSSSRAFARSISRAVIGHPKLPRLELTHAVQRQRT